MGLLDLLISRRLNKYEVSWMWEQLSLHRLCLVIYLTILGVFVELAVFQFLQFCVLLHVATELQEVFEVIVKSRLVCSDHDELVHHF